MNINLHIERLILDGLPIERHHAPLLKTAVEAELSRLLAANGSAPAFTSSGSRPAAPASEIQLARNVSPKMLGRQIARALYGGFDK